MRSSSSGFHEMRNFAGGSRCRSPRDFTSLRAGRGVDSEQATETPVLGAFEDDRLKRELEESNKKARRLDKAH
ncbi:uncharacterized protein A4U43_C10F9050 [Asparagus officinalis]|uniref:Uncharacterized protein n=1 Tax=Asparagus officinalis TaxID=4686 RepID=A0A5P1E1J3_ASPOF|nr:uncharacterized protein A4U43_C10F9050 [Asparagus officinalis]